MSSEPVTRERPSTSGPGDTPAPFNSSYTIPAKRSKLTTDIDRPKLSPADVRKLKAAQRSNQSSEVLS